MEHRKGGLLSPMTASPPPQARPCRCEHPLLDGETCFRCGRTVSLLPGPPLHEPRVARDIAWTPPGMVRAIRAFTFFRGRAPVSSDWKRRMGDDWPPLDAVERVFGSLEAALRAAGVEPAGSQAVGE
jgi:hypothetical protein